MPSEVPPKSYLSGMDQRVAHAAPYSYRTDPNVPRFDDSAGLVIFDGLCVLCSAGVHWMLARDPAGHSRFAAIQDDIPQAIYRHHNLDADAFDTFMVLSRGVPHVKWSGVLAAAATMPQPWRGLGQVGRVIPAVVGDKIYDWVQRNRIRWFGARDVCLRPDENTAHRFL